MGRVPTKESVWYSKFHSNRPHSHDTQPPAQVLSWDPQLIRNHLHLIFIWAQSPIFDWRFFHENIDFSHDSSHKKYTRPDSTDHFCVISMKNHGEFEYWLYILILTLHGREEWFFRKSTISWWIWSLCVRTRISHTHGAPTGGCRVALV